MKRFFLVFSFLVLGFALTSCGGTADSSVKDTTETPQAEPEIINIISDGKSDFSIVRAVNEGSAEIRLYSQFSNELYERCGVNMKLNVDALANGDCEILIGNTKRSESTALTDKLLSLGGNRFGIKMSGTKLAIVGTSLTQTYLALDYVLENFIDSNGTTMSVADGFEYISDDTPDVPFDPAALKEDGRGVSFVATELVANVPAESGFGIQGGGTDGKYAYYGTINGKTKPEPARIYKFDIETWELVLTSEILPTAHTNDITYDSKNHRLVVSNCSSLDGYYGITLLDPDTLEVISTFKAPVTSRAIEYLPELDQYVVGTGYTIMLTDAEWNRLSSFECADPRYTTQGLYCDGTYVYDVRYLGSKAEVHYVIIHDFDGNYIYSAPLRGVKGEPENIFKLGDDFYMGCNGSNAIFRLKLVPENWW